MDNSKQIGELQDILRELEGIKTRLLDVETRLIKGYCGLASKNVSSAYSDACAASRLVKAFADNETKE